jgi:hypothetical protein
MKMLTALTVLLCINSNLFASKARTQALGEQRTYGSFFIEDYRSIFLNPAKVNDYSDSLAFEWGADTRLSEDTADTPRAEGGYLASTNSGLVYGLWFGRENGTGNKLRSIADGSVSGTSAAKLYGEDNKLEFFIGGDTGLKWGARVDYSRSEDVDSGPSASGLDSQTASSASFGVISGNTEAFTTVSIVNEAETFNGEKFDGKFGMQVGVIQTYKDYKAYVELEYITFDYIYNVAAPQVEFKTTTAKLGFAKEKSLNEKAKVFSTVELNYLKTELESSTSGDLSQFNVPFVIGLEYEAKKWLMLRASVKQDVYSQNDYDAFNFYPAVASAETNGKNSNLDSTIIGTGFGINLDNFLIDGFMGSSKTDSFSSRVSLTYRF